MQILRSVDFVYTLYEDDAGALILALVVPAPGGAWASYEKRVVLDKYYKKLVRWFPEKIDKLANRLLAEEKRRQRVSSGG